MINMNSHVDDLNDSSVEGLFNALTEEPDQENRWTAYTYPVDLSHIFLPGKHDEQSLRKYD